MFASVQKRYAGSRVRQILDRLDSSAINPAIERYGLRCPMHISNRRVSSSMVKDSSVLAEACTHEVRQFEHDWSASVQHFSVYIVDELARGKNKGNLSRSRSRQAGPVKLVRDSFTRSLPLIWSRQN